MSRVLAVLCVLALCCAPLAAFDGVDVPTTDEFPAKKKPKDKPKDEPKDGPDQAPGEGGPKGGKGGDDAGGKNGKGKNDKGPKPYDEVITEDFESDPGLFTVHRSTEGDDTVYYEIPTSALDVEMVWVTQLAGTQAGYSWAGMPVGNRVVRWEQRGDRVLLRDVKYDIRADVDDPIALAVEATSVAPIIQVFEVAAYGKDRAPVIDVTKFFTTEQTEFSASEQLGAKGLDDKRSFIDEVKSFPINVETKVLATYKLQKERPGAPGQDGPRFPTGIPRDDTQSGVTVRLHHSMVKLPDDPMPPRIFDDRVGFFSVGFADYGDDSEHEVERVRYITRWRLEKKDPSAAVSDPVKPIVWYVSREVPEKWQQACIEGINMWQQAFESAGFSNAIVGKLAPTKREDPEWDAEDARYTTIRWLPSAVPNAFGPHIHDPRTGEILEADVRMFHNVMKLVRDWYFVQASPNDERAQQLPMPDDLMAELIRFVVAHEVGHSLGFPHNMKASSSYSVEQLRDRDWTRENGTAPSIMDYARFNYVAQPGDGAALMPNIGPYDHFAVEWGYRRYADDEAEAAGLAALVARQKDEPMLRFGNPNPFEDPTQQTEDLGGDPVEATRLGLANLERVAGYLVEATSREGEDYDLLENMHGALLGQWRREMVHVANVVGGVERVNLYYGDADARYFPVSADRQREAMAFLADNALATPELFLDPDVTRRVEAAGVADRVLGVQASVLNALTAPARIKRMSELEAFDPDGAYGPAEMMDDLTAAVWSELDGPAPSIDLYRRNLQRAWVERLASALDGDAASSDAPALARAQLTRLAERAAGAADSAGDALTAGHLDDVAARIEMALDKIKVESVNGGGGGGRRGIADEPPAVDPCF